MAEQGLIRKNSGNRSFWELGDRLIMVIRRSAPFGGPGGAGGLELKALFVYAIIVLEGATDIAWEQLVLVR